MIIYRCDKCNRNIENYESVSNVETSTNSDDQTTIEELTNSFQLCPTCIREVLALITGT